MVHCTPATGAEKAHEVILAILFAELLRMTNRSMTGGADFFERMAGGTENLEEQRVYQKFALTLRNVERDRQRGALWRNFSVVQGGKA